jgi:hypothetical protein
MTIEEFGKTIKAKYPQYTDLPDADLGQKMLSKYPQYKDMVTSQPEKKSLLNKVGDVAKGIGNFLISSEKSAGEQLANTISTNLSTSLGGTKGVAEKATQQYIESGDKLVQLAKTTTDKNKKDKLLKIAIDSYQKSGMTQEEITGKIPTKWDTLMAFGGVGLDILSAGTYGKAVKGMETFKYAAKAPTAIALGGKAITGAKEITQKGISKVGEIAKSGKALKIAEREAVSLPVQKFELRNQISAIREASKGTLKDMELVFNKTTEKLSQELISESKIATEIAKGNLKTLFKNTTNTYGKGLKIAEDALAKKGTQLSSKQYLEKVINTTLLEAKNRAIPETTKTMELLLDTSKRLANLADTNIPIEELKVFKNKIYETLSASAKSGSKFSGIDDQVASMFLRNHGSFIGEFSPELAKLNKEFAPLANASNWAKKNFKPYNPAEIQKGANILTQISKGKVPNETVLNYLKVLEEGSGSFKGAGKLTGKTLETGKNIKAVKESFEIAKNNLITSADFQINKLKSEIIGYQSRGIELRQQIDKLKGLVKIRNIIIGAVLLPSAIKRFAPIIGI